MIVYTGERITIHVCFKDNWTDRYPSVFVYGVKARYSETIIVLAFDQTSILSNGRCRVFKLRQLQTKMILVIANGMIGLVSVNILVVVATWYIHNCELCLKY